MASSPQEQADGSAAIESKELINSEEDSMQKESPDRALGEQVESEENTQREEERRMLSLRGLADKTSSEHNSMAFQEYFSELSDENSTRKSPPDYDYNESGRDSVALNYSAFIEASNIPSEDMRLLRLLDAENPTARAAKPIYKRGEFIVVLAFFVLLGVFLYKRSTSK